MCFVVSDNRKGLDLNEKSSPYWNLNWNQGYAFPIRNIFVPQEGHVPWVAGLPFFIVIAFGSFISFLARHFTQYACIFHLLSDFSLYLYPHKKLVQICLGLSEQPIIQSTSEMTDEVVMASLPHALIPPVWELYVFKSWRVINFRGKKLQICDIFLISKIKTDFCGSRFHYWLAVPQVTNYGL